MNKAKYNILLALTGGTICSFADSIGERSSKTEKAQALIVENFRKSNSLYKSEDKVKFTPCFLLDILSENQEYIGCRPGWDDMYTDVPNVRNWFKSNTI